jgi:hypothetical protein
METSKLITWCLLLGLGACTVCCWQIPAVYMNIIIISEDPHLSASHAVLLIFQEQSNLSGTPLTPRRARPPPTPPDPCFQIGKTPSCKSGHNIVAFASRWCV